MADRPSLRRLVDRLSPGLGAGVRGLLGAAGAERLGGIQRKVGPGARLMRLDTGVFRAWMRNVVAVEEALGAAEAAAYTELVVSAAERDPSVARSLAFSLPDHLARVLRSDRGRYAALLRAVNADRPEAMPLVVRTLPDLLRRMDDASLARYLATALELYSESVQKAESFLKMESEQGQLAAASMQRGVRLADVQRRLSLYARAHCGEDVQVRPGDAGAFTDGRHLYLPERIDRFGDTRDALIYRVQTARNAGFIEFGTLNLDLNALPGEWPHPRPDELNIERFFRGFPNVSLARDLFRILEGARVEARVRGEYPGVSRDMDALAEAWRPERPELAALAPAEQAVEGLARAVLGLPAPLYAEARVAAAALSATAVLQDVLAPDATVQTTAVALQRAFAPVYALLVLAEPPGRPPRPPPGGNGGPGSGDRNPDPDSGSAPQPREGADEPQLDYRPGAPDPFGGELRTEAMSSEDRQVESRVSALLDALRAREPETTVAEARDAARQRQMDGSSYEEMADFLDRLQAPAGPLAERAEDREEAPNLPVGHTTGQALDADTAAKVGTALYPEWDLTIEDYKPRWVRLTEYTLKPGSTAFVEEVRRRHGPLVGQIRRAFEALRPEAIRRVRGVVDGDEIDLQAAVEAHVERRAGGSPTDRLYTRHRRDERDVAVAFLVDMSSSTNELANVGGQRIIDVEKEALVLISEAIEAIGDAAAIYGFSGYGREQVAFYVAKDFSDPWDGRVTERIGRISWKMENRDGAAIRHCTRKLLRAPARQRLMLLLSDGKPLDCGCDQYSDRYAQEDTRVALQEARALGIHPFCITVDVAAQEYLSRMYGEGGYTIIDRVDALPTRLPQIYRRLTR